MFMLSWTNAGADSRMDDACDSVNVDQKLCLCSAGLLLWLILGQMKTSIVLRWINIFTLMYIVAGVDSRMNEARDTVGLSISEFMIM